MPGGLRLTKQQVNDRALIFGHLHDRRAPSMVQRDFTPGPRCALHHKDLGILTSAARDAGAAIPLGAAAAQLMGALVAQGHGDLDNTALLRLVEDLSGRGR